MALDSTADPRLPPGRVAVIGGGLSGLAAAFRLRELDPDLEVVVFEATDRWGGVLRTEHRDGFLLECGADMFTTREPWARDLCRRIGLDDQLLATNTDFRRAFIVHRGQLCPVPDGFTLMSPTRVWPLVRTPLLSWRGKLRMALEYFVGPRQDESDESLADFSRRRMGSEVYDRLIQPLIGGIYTADPEKLSMQAALPEFVAMERRHSSIIRAVRQKQAENRSRSGAESGARYGMFLTPREGMGALVDAIAGRLPRKSIRLQQAVTSLTRTNEARWQVHASNPGESPEQFDGLILATPAPAASRLLGRVHEQLAEELRQIGHASAVVVLLGYRRTQIQHPLDGFGCVAPLCEQRKVLSISFSSIKFEGRAPAGTVLLRAFVGGAVQEELVKLEDSEIEQLVKQELSELIGATGQPLFSQIVRWRDAMPQYHLDHLRRVERIEACVRSLPNFALAGNAYRGVGIPSCVRSGEAAADSVYRAIIQSAPPPGRR